MNEEERLETLRIHGKYSALNKALRKANRDRILDELDRVPGVPHDRGYQLRQERREWEEKRRMDRIRIVVWIILILGFLALLGIAMGVAMGVAIVMSGLGG